MRSADKVFIIKQRQATNIFLLLITAISCLWREAARGSEEFQLAFCVKILKLWTSGKCETLNISYSIVCIVNDVRQCIVYPYFIESIVVIHCWHFHIVYMWFNVYYSYDINGKCSRYVVTLYHYTCITTADILLINRTFQQISHFSKSTSRAIWLKKM